MPVPNASGAASSFLEETTIRTDRADCWDGFCISNGPVSFMKLFDYACEITRSGGARRGANMGLMRFDHPDILEFITAKTQTDTLQTFNISVAASDAFMDLVQRHANCPLINPRTGQEVDKLNARQVFDAIVDSARRTGDPGLVFLDTINRQNPLAAVASIEATNPCDEQPLLPYESWDLERLFTPSAYGMQRMLADLL